MLTDQDLIKVQETCREMTFSVTIVVTRGAVENDFERNLVSVAAQISGVSANRIEIREGQEAIFAGKPSLVLSIGDGGNIHYLASPEGAELSPFLDAVSWLGGAKSLPASQGLELVEGLRSPVHMMILMAAACPYCPEVVRSALALAVRQNLITLSIVDALQFSDLAERYKVKSTPTIIVNDGLTLIGRISTEELARHLIRADDPGSLTATLESMINSGRAEDAAALMCRLKQPAAALPLYKSQEFSTRMGVLVTFEAALDRDPRILDPIVGELTELLFQDDVALRGDTAELLGNIGNPAAIPALRKASEDPDEDVREAAQEALESIGL